MKPIIAIIGRPNVGKSTFFNRLSKRKKAIVIDEPGATRDRNYADCTWNDRDFILIDTGGFEPVSREKILIQMREQTTLAIEEADTIIFLMDGREGLTPSDVEIANLLREAEKPTFFVINKIDGPKQEELAYEFYRLGIEKLYTISSEHGVGVGGLMDDVVEYLPVPDAVSEDEQRIRIAVIGKPNVGKSSIINNMLGYERTIVNPLPGTTRDAIDTPFELNDRKYLLIDTAGIRRKSKISITLEKYSVVQALKTMSRSDIALMLIDAEEGITDQDTKIAGLAFERGVVCIIVVNKWDLIKKDNSTMGNYVRDIKEKLKFLNFAPTLFVSALTGQRVMKIFDTIETAYIQYTRRVQTSILNNKVQEFLEINPPPRYQRKAHNFSYVTQASVKPPTFVFFVHEPKAVHFSYQRYLTNKIREEFGFDHVPIKIILRKKTK
ncbi:MAG: ribosome biogenesis GTPase Der [Syntrophales bacterium]|nr:ribosome biogenesis GTPase Der [Syntrophales bacterium]